MRLTLRTRALVVLLLSIFMLLYVGVAVSSADSASLSVTNTAGEPDPVAGLPRVFTLSGSTAAPEHVYAKSRATGGSPCAPSADSDSGQIVETDEESDLAYGTSVNGEFSLKHVYTWEPPGAELFCIWIAETGTQVVTPISQVITFRAPSGVISASINPSTPRPNEQATVTVSGSTEAPEEVFATVRAAGAPCAPDYSADNGQDLFDGTAANGSYSVQKTLTEENAGSYQLCVWLASSPISVPAIAGPQSILFAVANPPPPPPPPPPPGCVVPTFSRMRLTTVEHRIRAGHCRVGHVHYTHARHVKRGYVVAVSPRPRTRLSNGAHVVVVVSLGRPHR